MSWEKIKANMENRLKEVLSQNSKLPIYIWSYHGQIPGRGAGFGWVLEIHLEDDSLARGVKHIIIGRGDSLTSELSSEIKAWFQEITKKYPGKKSPTIDVSIDC